MKKFRVGYNTTTSYEAVVEANNEAEAKRKVKEVIGDPIEFENIWEVKGK